MKRILLLLLVIACASGCTVELPPITSIPPNTPHEVRKSIQLLHGDAASRERGCIALINLTSQHVDCSAAVPSLIALLSDESVAHFAVCDVAAEVLINIGEPVMPALQNTVKTSTNRKQRERAQELLVLVRHGNQPANLTTAPSTLPCSQSQ